MLIAGLWQDVKSSSSCMKVECATRSFTTPILTCLRFTFFFMKATFPTFKHGHKLKSVDMEFLLGILGFSHS